MRMCTISYTSQVKARNRGGSRASGVSRVGDHLCSTDPYRNVYCLFLFQINSSALFSFKQYLRQFDYIARSRNGKSGGLVAKDKMATALKTFQRMVHIPVTGK